MPRTLFISFGLASALSLFGCSSSDNPPAAPGCVDFSQLPTTPVSFKDDIMPIFGLGCTASSCHDKSTHKADLVLGDPSSFPAGKTTCYDANSKWGCTLATPIDPVLLDQVAKNLVGVASKTNPLVQRVAPGKPDQSFLVDKVGGLQDSKQYPGPCTNQEPSRGAGPCGEGMPAGNGSLCADSPAKVQAIAMWIAQGASGTN